MKRTIPPLRRLRRPNRVDPLESRRLLSFVLPDVTWGDAGLVDLPVGEVAFIAPVAGGEILFVADTPNRQGVAIGRRNADGSPDPSFGPGGLGEGYTAPGNFDVHSATLQADGKLLVTGYRDNGLTVARLNADGTLDTSFGVDGLTAPVPSGQGGFVDANRIFGIAVQSTGRIIAAGLDGLQLQDHNAQFGVLLGFTLHGALDPTFGDHGKAFLNFEDGLPQALAVSADDTITIAGYSTTSGAFVARHGADGDFDSTFGGGDGFAFVDLPDTNDELNSIALVPDGRILAGGGTYGPNVASDFHPLYLGVPALLSLNADGSPDTTFGGGDGVLLGEVGTGPFNTGDAKRIFTAIAPDTAGNIVAAARYDNTASVKGRLTVYRVTPEGLLDTTFTPTGKLETTTEFYPSSLAIQSDGRIVLGGADGNSGSIARLSEPLPVEVGANGILYVRGTDDPDTVTLQPDGGNVKLIFNGVETTYPAADIHALDIEAGGDNDVITVSLGINAIVRPGAGNDLVITSTGNDRITEPAIGSGRDTIRSSDGDDSIDSGDGDDRVIAGSGRTTLTAGAGDDSVTIGDGAMLVNLDAGHDLIDTGWQSDTTINGGTGNDTIKANGHVFILAGVYKDKSGLADDDEITVHGGPVFIRTEGGNNRVFVDTRRNTSIGCGPGNDLVVSGSGDDRIDPMGGDDTVYSNGGDDVIQQIGGSDFIDAGSGNDMINSGFIGPAAPDTIYGSAGNDSIRVETGGVIYCGSGNDFVDARENPGIPTPSAPVTVYGHSGDDSITGGGSNDSLSGGDGNDTISGFTGADKLFGADGDDRLAGGGGADMLVGDIGNDILLGNYGNDRLFALDGSADTVNGGDGEDSYAADDVDELIRLEQAI